MLAIPYPLEIKDKKYTWHPYAVSYQGPDGPGMFHIYALSEEHAIMRLQDIRDTSKVVGKVVVPRF